METEKIDLSFLRFSAPFDVRTLLDHTANREVQKKVLERTQFVLTVSPVHVPSSLAVAIYKLCNRCYLEQQNSLQSYDAGLHDTAKKTYDDFLITFSGRTPADKKKIVTELAEDVFSPQAKEGKEGDERVGHYILSNLLQDWNSQTKGLSDQEIEERQEKVRNSEDDLGQAVLDVALPMLNSKHVPHVDNALKLIHHVVVSRPKVITQEIAKEVFDLAKADDKHPDTQRAISVMGDMLSFCEPEICEVLDRAGALKIDAVFMSRKVNARVERLITLHPQWGSPASGPA